MPNEVFIGDLSIGMEQITLDTANLHPEEETPLCPSLSGGSSFATTYAKRILDSGRNVIVQPANQWYRNTYYVECWNRYAQGLNLWVKFMDDINPDDEGIRVVVM